MCVNSYLLSKEESIIKDTKNINGNWYSVLVLEEIKEEKSYNHGNKCFLDHAKIVESRQRFCCHGSGVKQSFDNSRINVIVNEQAPQLNIVNRSVILDLTRRVTKEILSDITITAITDYSQSFNHYLSKSQARIHYELYPASYTPSFEFVSKEALWQKTGAITITKTLKFDEPRLTMGGRSVANLSELRILGLTIDKGLTLNTHVSTVCRRALSIFKQLSRAEKVS
jgi:hypothetical protein